MGMLDTAVRVAEHWDKEQGRARTELVRLIQSALESYAQAKGVWEDYIASAPRAPLSGSRWTILNWIGAERAHRLWSLNHHINECFARIAHLTDTSLPWSFPTDEVMIDAADKQFVQLGAEVGTHAAKVAIERINERMDHALTLLKEIESLPS